MMTSSFCHCPYLCVCRRRTERRGFGVCVGGFGSQRFRGRSAAFAVVFHARARYPLRLPPLLSLLIFSASLPLYCSSSSSASASLVLLLFLLFLLFSSSIASTLLPLSHFNLIHSSSLPYGSGHPYWRIDSHRRLVELLCTTEYYFLLMTSSFVILSHHSFLVSPRASGMPPPAGMNPNNPNNVREREKTVQLHLLSSSPSLLLVLPFLSLLFPFLLILSPSSRTLFSSASTSAYAPLF